MYVTYVKYVKLTFMDLQIGGFSSICSNTLRYMFHSAVYCSIPQSKPKHNNQYWMYVMYQGTFKCSMFTSYFFNKTCEKVLFYR